MCCLMKYYHHLFHHQEKVNDLKQEIYFTQVLSSIESWRKQTTSLSTTIYAPFSSSSLHAYSSSFKKGEYQPPSDYLSGYRRSQFEGVKNTINTTTDGELPVIVGASSPTAVISKQSGEGKKLEVIRKK